MAVLVQNKQRRRRAGLGVRGWPKVTVHLAPPLVGEVRALAVAKGYSVSEALGEAIEHVGLPYLRALAPRGAGGGPAGGGEAAPERR